ncbi:hypothetical protein D3C72_1570500 [compost metagenome]
MLLLFFLFLFLQLGHVAHDLPQPRAVGALEEHGVVGGDLFEQRALQRLQRVEGLHGGTLRQGGGEAVVQPRHALAQQEHAHRMALDDGLDERIVMALRVVAQLLHVAEHEQLAALFAGLVGQRGERRGHRQRVRVV